MSKWYNSSTGAITPSTSTAGTYTVTYTIPASGGCAAIPVTTSVTITAMPAATISYAGSPFCSTASTPQSVTLTGTTGGTYTSTTGLTINSSTGAVTPSTSTLGTYTVTYTIAAAGGCSLFSTTTSVSIDAAPTANISYPGTPFCSSLSSAQPVTISGTGAYTGGAYTATPAGLTINSSTGAITPSTSTAGTYTVTYTIPALGGCSAIPVTTSVTITAMPAATISYTGSPFCTSISTPQTVTFTGTTGGTYTSTTGLTINSSTGAITPSTSTPGTYTVTYTVAAAGGCSLFSTTASVSINAAPTANISYSGTPFCSSVSTAQSVTISGTGTYTGGAYTALPAGLTINSSTGAITPNTSTAGIYTVTYIIPASGGCSAIPVTTSVTITTMPAATISYAGTPFCTSISTPQSVTFTGTTGGTYTSTTGLTINSSTGAITPSTSTPGTYTVIYTVAAAGGCSLFSTTASVSINAAPTANISYSGTPFCNSVSTAQSLTISGTGTYTGGAYTALPAGLTINSSTGAITPSTSTAGTYTVTYTIPASGGCSAIPVTTSVTITTMPAATISYAGTPFCTSISTPQTVTFTGTTGGTYTSTTGLTINASTGAITPSTSTPGTYTVTYTVAAAGGCSLFSTTSSVTIDAKPTAYTVTGGGSFCAGGSGVVVGLNGSNTGITYQLQVGGSNIGSPVSGTGSAITFGNQTSAGTYTVIATNTTTLCQNTMTGSVVITIISNPIANAGTNDTICKGSSTVLNATGGTSYAWSPSSGLSNASISNPSASPSVTTTYTVIVYSSGCSASADVTVNIFGGHIIHADTVLCHSDSVFFYATTSVPAYTYSWTGGSTLSYIHVKPTVSTTYYVTITEGSKTCIDSAKVIIPIILTGSITGLDTVVQNSTHAYSVNSHTGSTYQWIIIGGSETSGGTTNSINIIWGTPGHGKIAVIETDVYGCVGDTVYLNVVIESNVGIISYNDNPEIKIIPNPFNDNTTVYFDKEIQSFDIIDVTGKIIRSYSNINGNKLLIPKENMADGLYIYKIIFRQGDIKTGKLIVE